MLDVLLIYLANFQPLITCENNVEILTQLLKKSVTLKRSEIYIASTKNTQFD